MANFKTYEDFITEEWIDDRKEWEKKYISDIKLELDFYFHSMHSMYELSKKSPVVDCIPYAKDDGKGGNFADDWTISRDLEPIEENFNKLRVGFTKGWRKQSQFNVYPIYPAFYVQKDVKTNEYTYWEVKEDGSPAYKSKPYQWNYDRWKTVAESLKLGPPIIWITHFAIEPESRSDFHHVLINGDSGSVIWTSERSVDAEKVELTKEALPILWKSAKSVPTNTSLWDDWVHDQRGLSVGKKAGII